MKNANTIDVKSIKKNEINDYVYSFIVKNYTDYLNLKSNVDYLISAYNLDSFNIEYVYRFNDYFKILRKKYS